MYPLLRHLRVVEGASFIAGPSCCLHLAQLGAEVIRFDDLARAPDRGRWPLALSGHSLYWEGLNKGKKSVAIDLSRPQGRELAIAITSGMDDPLLRDCGPYDLLIANILAGPLVNLARDFAAAVPPRGNLVLAGLLTTQEQSVRAAYRAAGFALARRIVNGDWSILWLRRRFVG